MSLIKGSPFEPYFKRAFNSIYINKEYNIYNKGRTPAINLAHLFEILQSKINLSNPFNVLIGAKNTVDSDYSRFKDSHFSLFIDKENPDIDTEERILERQYEMFTILLPQDIFKEIETLLQYEKIGRFVDNYIVDIMTAYFLNRSIYIKLVEKTLKFGGQFIFEYTNHSADVYRLDKEHNLLIGANNNINLKSLPEYEINEREHTIKIVNSNVFHKMGLLAPSMFLITYYEDGNTKYYNLINFHEQYLKYLKENYPKFDVELKTYTFTNFTYPVPLNINNTSYIKMAYDILMTEEERNNYNITKMFNNEQIEQLIIRMRESEGLSKQVLDLVEREIRRKISIDIFRELLLEQFNKIRYYYILTLKFHSIGQGSSEASGYQMKYLKYKKKYLSLKDTFISKIKN